MADDIKPTGKSGFGDGGNAKPSEPIIGASIDPATLAGNGNDGIELNKDGSPRQKRGRKAGSGAGSSKTANKGDLKASVDSLSKILLVLHAGIAGVSKTPELVIDGSESDLLAGATVNLLDQFDITPDPKLQAAIALVVAAGTVYAPRVVAIKMRKSRDKKEASQTLDMTSAFDNNGLN